MNIFLCAQFIRGLHDFGLHEKLLPETNLSYEKAVNITTGTEASRKGNPLIYNSNTIMFNKFDAAIFN